MFSYQSRRLLEGGSRDVGADAGSVASLAISRAQWPFWAVISQYRCLVSLLPALRSLLDGAEKPSWGRGGRVQRMGAQSQDGREKELGRICDTISSTRIQMGMSPSRSWCRVDVMLYPLPSRPPPPPSPQPSNPVGAVPSLPSRHAANDDIRFRQPYSCKRRARKQSYWRLIP